MVFVFFGFFFGIAIGILVVALSPQLVWACSDPGVLQDSLNTPWGQGETFPTFLIHIKRLRRGISHQLMKNYLKGLLRAHQLKILITFSRCPGAKVLGCGCTLCPVSEESELPCMAQEGSVSSFVFWLLE